MNFYGKKLCLPMYAMLALIGCSIAAHAEAIDAEKAKEFRSKIESQKAEEKPLTRKQEEQLKIDEENVMDVVPG